MVIIAPGVPRLDGHAVAAGIVAISPTTPLIALTGWSQRLAADGDIPREVTCVLRRPPRLSDLRQALVRCMVTMLGATLSVLPTNQVMPQHCTNRTGGHCIMHPPRHRQRAKPHHCASDDERRISRKKRCLVIFVDREPAGTVITGFMSASRHVAQRWARWNRHPVFLARFAPVVGGPLTPTTESSCHPPHPNPPPLANLPWIPKSPSA